MDTLSNEERHYSQSAIDSVRVAPLRWPWVLNYDIKYESICMGTLADLVFTPITASQCMNM